MLSLWGPAAAQMKCPPSQILAGGFLTAGSSHQCRSLPTAAALAVYGWALLRQPTTSPTCLPVEQPTQPSSSLPFRALPLLFLALLQLNCAPAVPRGADPQHNVQQLVRPRATALLTRS